MDRQLLFARHFARLVWLLAHERDAVDEQKGALRAMMTLAREGGVRLERAGGALLADGAPVAAALAGVAELAARLEARGVRALAVDAAAGPADVLDAARALAGDAEPAEGTAVRWEREPGAAGRGAGAAREAAAREAEAREAEAREAAAREAEEAARREAVAREVRERADASARAADAAREAARERERIIAAEARAVREAMEARARAGAPPRQQDAPPEAADRHPPAPPRTETPRAESAQAHTAPVATPAAEDDDDLPPIAREHALLDPSELPALAPVPVRQAAAPTEAAAAAAAQEGTPAAALALAGVDAAAGDTALGRALEALTEAATRAARDEDPATVVALWRGVLRRETQARGLDARAAYVAALGRLSRPTVLRAVAAGLAAPALERDATSALTRAGADGAAALVELLSSASAAETRAVYFAAFAKLDAGVPTLVRMLRDARWHVARDAAVLLGELRATTAEGPLADLMVHEDDRVRRAAAIALGRLSTPEAVRALRGALGDVAPAVRAQAAVCLAEREGASSADTLSTALDAEEDAEVQHAILAALGRLGTADAVQRLIRAAEPDRRLFRKKNVSMRVAAVRALGEATSSAAVGALQALANDREREVRDAAVEAARDRAARERAARTRQRPAHA